MKATPLLLFDRWISQSSRLAIITMIDFQSGQYGMNQMNQQQANQGAFRNVYGVLGRILFI